MDRKKIQLDREALEELVERLCEFRDNCLDQCDRESLTLSIRGISQVTKFAQDVGFEVSIPIEERGEECGWQPPGTHLIPCRRKAGHTGKHCWGSADARRMDEEAVLKPLPDFFAAMTLGSFLDHCKSGCLTDYDGFGAYATETQVSAKKVHPSDVAAGVIDTDYTHVVWYKK